MLLYPGTDMSMSQPSYQRDFTRFPLSIEAIEYFIGHYLRDRSDYTDPRAAPLLATNFKQLAPAFVLTAGYDPLADEGMAYARKLEDKGVPVTLVHMSDQMHGFLTMGPRHSCVGVRAENGWHGPRSGFQFQADCSADTGA
jgi:acetyl esterase